MKLRQIMKDYKQSKRSSVTVYIILRLLIIASIIGQAIRGNYDSAFLCFLALLCLTVPIFLQKALKIVLPNVLEIIIFFFIFSAQILGEIHNFYGNVPHWDTMLHTANGFLCAGIGFALIDLLNKNGKHIRLSPLYISLAAFCFSMTVAVCWEFFEYSMDVFFLQDMQKDTVITTISSVYLDPLQANNAVVIKDIAQMFVLDANGDVLTSIEGGYLDIGLHDTMKDMFVNFIGAVVFSTFGYFYVKKRDKFSFVKNFIPEKAAEENIPKKHK